MCINRMLCALKYDDERKPPRNFVLGSIAWQETRKKEPARRARIRVGVLAIS